MNTKFSSQSSTIEGFQRGIVVVEFAVGVLLVLAVMLSAAEIGRAYYSYNTLTKSVRAGARYLSINALNSAYVVDLNTQVVQDTSNIVVSGQAAAGTPLLPGFVVGNVSVSETTAPSGTNNPYIKVSASYPYAPMIGSIPSLNESGGLNLQFTMVAESTMRILR